MTKVILITLTTFSFLIGCSFSKKNDSTSDSKANHIDDIFEKVRTSPIPSLRSDLSKISPEQLNSLKKDGKSLLDTALERGSSDVIVELITAGMSPFIPNSSGKSLYTQIEDSVSINFPYANLNKMIIEKATGRIQKTMTFEEGRQLADDVNTFTSPCDLSILQLAKAPSNTRKISIENFIALATKCPFSLQKENSSRAFEIAFSKYLENDVDINYQELASLYLNLPSYAIYLDIGNIGGRCRLHASIVMELLFQEFPEKSERFLQAIEGSIDSNNQAFQCDGRSWAKSISLRDAKKGLQGTLATLSNQVIKKFRPNQEAQSD